MKPHTIPSRFSLILAAVVASPLNAAPPPEEVFVTIASESSVAEKRSLGMALGTLVGEALAPKSRVHILSTPRYSTVTAFEVPPGGRRARLHHRSLKPAWRSLGRFLSTDGGDSAQLNLPLLATKVRELRRTASPVSIILVGTMLYSDPEQPAWRFNPLVPTDDCLDAPYCPFASGPDFPLGTRVSWLVPATDFQIHQQVRERLFHFYRLHFQKKSARLLRITDNATSALSFEPPQFEGEVTPVSEGIAMRNAIDLRQVKVLPPVKVDQQIQSQTVELETRSNESSLPATAPKPLTATESARPEPPESADKPSVMNASLPSAAAIPAPKPSSASIKPAPKLTPVAEPILATPKRAEPLPPILRPKRKPRVTPAFPRPAQRSVIPCQGGRVVFVVDRSKSMVLNEDDVSTAWKDERLREDLYRNIRTLPFLEFAVVGYRSIPLCDGSERHEPEFNFFKRWFFSPWWMGGSPKMRESACSAISKWPCRGGTPTLEALQQANKLSGIRTIVLYSDGPASETDNDSVYAYVRILAQRGIVLHTVGVPSTSRSSSGPFDESARAFLRKVAEAGGGTYFEL